MFASGGGLLRLIRPLRGGTAVLLAAFLLLPSAAATADPLLEAKPADGERYAHVSPSLIDGEDPGHSILPLFSLLFMPRADREGEGKPLIVRLMRYAFFIVILMVCVYILRHYYFTLNRLYRNPRQPYVDVDTAEWPGVTVLIPAHNEEVVIGDIIDALLDSDYPRDKLTITPIDDRSKDNTREVIREFQLSHPDVVKPFHREKGKPGKAAALNDAMAVVENDVVLVFDADYIPSTGLIKQLVAPFFDPEVGAVMGRVVPHNVEHNLLTRLLDLERSGGYQVDQQARMNMRLVPQYGGTVGGVRRSALKSVGGWRDDSLAEDTDATYRLLLNGWKTVYQNRSECYEQVPQTWNSRLRQIKRWAMGHNQSAARYGMKLLRNKRVSLAEKLDGWLLLGVYAMSPILIFGWMLGIILWYLGENKPGLIIILLVTTYSTLGNFATFFEVAAAARLDGSRQRIRLIPFVSLGFLVSLFAVSRATVTQILPHRRNGEVRWQKTEHKNGNGAYKNGNHTNNHVNGYRNGYRNNHYANGKNGVVREIGGAAAAGTGDPGRERGRFPLGRAILALGLVTVLIGAILYNVYMRPREETPATIARVEETRQVEAPAGPTPSAAPAPEEKIAAVVREKAPEKAPEKTKTTPDVTKTARAGKAEPRATEPVKRAGEARKAASPAPVAPVPAAGPFYSVHVESYTSKENADRNADRFRSGDDPVTVCIRKIPESGTWYRIVLGRFPRMSQAKTRAEEIKDELGLSYTLAVRVPKNSESR